ncbi:hypothetical protein PVL30_004743 [Lodderomyces elongisporus]|uniref:uncharacterized protein n=1 Tax=Lodderomyces elongisporus TaxID=36914 RepID=UPI002922BC90|nr:uncharacterized protein PVL30_004743 [Lodderomyces elongisporus]WLF80949.1 hypothetical protein PVL30_004743 [Lodderomyces elongisporus]
MTITATRMSNRLRKPTAKAITNNLQFLVNNSNKHSEQPEQPKEKEYESVKQCSSKRPSEETESLSKKKKKKLCIEEDKTTSTSTSTSTSKPNCIDDPVEKLLYLTNINNFDILTDLESEVEEESRRRSFQSIDQLQDSCNSLPSPYFSQGKKNKRRHSKSLRQAAERNQGNEDEDDDEDEDEDQESEEDEEEEEEEPLGIESVDFTKIIHDNIREYYRQKGQNQYKDSFALLNTNNRINYQDGLSRVGANEDGARKNAAPASQVPFFKSVNFNGLKEYSIEDFVNYGEDEEEQEHEQEQESEKKVEKDAGSTTGVCGFEKKSETISPSSSTSSLSSVFSCPKNKLQDLDDEDPHSISPIASPETTKLETNTINFDCTNTCNKNCNSVSVGTATTATTSSTTPSSSSSSSTLYIPKIKHTAAFSPFNRYSPFSFSFQARNGFNSGCGGASQHDDYISKALKKHSLYTGKAREMVSTGNFMINDFFL